MASIRKDINIDRRASDVWADVAATGAIHERLARDFVTDTRVDGATRLVTFVTGAVARELIVDVDQDARRLAYAVVESPLGLRHHHATMQVVADGDDRSHLIWIADVAPDDGALVVGEMMEHGALAMQRTLEGVSR